MCLVILPGRKKGREEGKEEEGRTRSSPPGGGLRYCTAFSVMFISFPGLRHFLSVQVPQDTLHKGEDHIRYSIFIKASQPAGPWCYKPWVSVLYSIL